MTLFYIALRETAEFSIILLLLIGIYQEYKKPLIISAVLVVVTGILIAWLDYPPPGFLIKASTGFMHYSFIMVLLLSFVAGRAVVYPVVSLVFMLLLPSAQLAAVIMDEASLKGGYILVSPFAGMLVGALIFAFCVGFLPALDIKRFFGAGGIMVFLSAFCFLVGGLEEFDRSSVITSLQRGFYAFFSSFIPFLKGLLLIPSGGRITTAFDGPFDFLSSQRVAMASAASILFIPPLYIFIKLLITPEPVTEGIGKKAERRKVTAIYLHELIRKGTPLLMSLLVSIVLLHSANLSMQPSYEPEPIPVVNEGDALTIPLIDKFGDISDGRMRKYSFLDNGESYRFFIIMRPDGEVTAALDACEICPPTGYVQRAEYVICKYCNTPIPALTLGQPGGCNPIPVGYRVEGDTIVLSKRDIVAAYKKGAGKEGIRH